MFEIKIDNRFEKVEGDYNSVCLDSIDRYTRKVQNHYLLQPSVLSSILMMLQRVKNNLVCEDEVNVLRVWHSFSSLVVLVVKRLYLLLVLSLIPT